MDEVAISLTNVSKCYKRYAHPVDRLKEILLPGKSRAKEFWALRNINLDVYAGESLGIVGQNGSGKSTLLQIIAGTLTPTTGNVKVNGRISALLELGSGFNPEFTGRQNVFFNGQILGLSRAEVEAKFDKIAAFAEIGDFLDQPVKTYSSGMVVRLAFAVVANIEPKILIVDEALAVGDARFQARCMKRIRQLKDRGVTVLFVSHDAGSIKMLCNRAVLINRGHIIEIGTPKQIVNQYIAILSSEQKEINDFGQFLGGDRLAEIDSNITNDTDKNLDSDRPSSRHGNKLATIKSVKIKSLDKLVLDKIETNSLFNVSVLIQVQAELEDIVVGISIKNLLGLVIYGTNNKLMQVKLPKIKSNEQLSVNFTLPCYMNKGIYTLTVGLHSEEGLSYDWIDELIVFEVTNFAQCDGIVDCKAKVEFTQINYVSQET